MKKTLAYPLALFTATALIAKSTFAQTVDISEKPEAVPASKGGTKIDFDVALTLAKRNFETLRTSSGNFRVRHREQPAVQEAWLRWINKEAAAKKTPETLAILTRMARNRAAHLDGLCKPFHLGDTGAPEFSPFLSREELMDRETSSQLSPGRLLATDILLTKALTCDFPLDLHPEALGQHVGEVQAQTSPLADYEWSGRVTKSWVPNNWETDPLVTWAGRLPGDFSTLFGPARTKASFELPVRIGKTLKVGEYGEALEVALETFAASSRDFPQEPALLVKSALWVARLASELNKRTLALEYAKKAAALCAESPGIDARLRCRTQAQLGRALGANGQDAVGVEALQEGLRLFTSEVHYGRPCTEQESSLITALVDACSSLSDNASGPATQQVFQTLLPTMEDLLATYDDPQAPVSEQLAMDTFRIVRMSSLLTFLTGSPEKALAQINHIANAGETLRGSIPFSRLNGMFSDALVVKIMIQKALKQESQLHETTKLWVRNYKESMGLILQSSSEEARLRFLAKQKPFNVVANFSDPLAIAEMVLYAKGAVLESILHERSISLAAADPALRAELAAIQSEKARTPSPPDPATASRLRDRERALSEKVRRATRESDMADMLKRTDFRGIPKSLPPNAAYIDFFQFDETSLSEASKSKRYAAIVITQKGKLTFRPLAPAEEVDTLVAELRSAVAQPGSTKSDAQTEKACRDLHAALLAPFEDQLKDVNHLVVCPDGSLNFLPFAALLTKSGRFLAEECLIRYCSSGRDLLRNVATSETRDMVILANPAFDAPDTNTGTDGVFQPLPGTELESATAAETMRKAGYTVRLLQGATATEESLRSLESPRILHLATHGFNLAASQTAADSAGNRGMKSVGTASPAENGAARSFVLPDEPNPMLRAGLALHGANQTFAEWTRGNQPIREQDGILQALEVPSIDLAGTWLVVLSACQTAEGEALRGEGVFGLRRGFIQAGVQNLLMTLWPIADTETADIMSEFYEKLASGAAEPGAVLSQIQKDWLRRLRTEKGISFAIHRSAPFILSSQGNGQNSPTKKTGPSKGPDPKITVTPRTQLTAPKPQASAKKPGTGREALFRLLEEFVKKWEPKVRAGRMSAKDIAAIQADAKAMQVRAADSGNAAEEAGQPITPEEAIRLQSLAGRVQELLLRLALLQSGGQR